MSDLYGDATGNAIRVAIALEEAGLPYRPVKVELKDGAQRSRHPKAPRAGQLLTPRRKAYQPPWL